MSGQPRAGECHEQETYAPEPIEERLPAAPVTVAIEALFSGVPSQCACFVSKPDAFSQSSHLWARSCEATVIFFQSLQRYDTSR